MSLSFGGQTQSLQQLERVIQEKKIDQVLLTHGHLDHVGGVMSLQPKVDFSQIYASKIESQYLKSGASAIISPFYGLKCDPIAVSQEINEGDIIRIGEFSFEVLHTPGHTHGSVSLWENKQQILISGDTVFPQGSFGRTDLPSGSTQELITSLERLSKLNVKILLPGHMPPMISSSDTTAKSIHRSYQIAREMMSYY